MSKSEVLQKLAREVRGDTYRDPRSNKSCLVEMVAARHEQQHSLACRPHALAAGSDVRRAHLRQKRATGSVV